MTSSWCGQKEKITLKLYYIMKYILSIQQSSLHSNIQILYATVFPSQMHKSISTIAKQKLISTQTEPTDKHQYLLKTSCHPAHTKRTIYFSLALLPRLRHICSTDDFFNNRCNELINFPELRGYSCHFLKKKINWVRAIPRQETLKPQPQNNHSNRTRTPFVITYNPALPNIPITVRKNINILQSFNRRKQTFPSPPIVAFKRSPSLRDLKVQKHFPKCNHPRCLTRPFLKQGQANYTFTSIKEKRCIHGALNCKSKDLIYLIECKKCGKQYIGETKRHLHKRFGSIAAPFSTMATLLILLLSPNILIKPITLSKTSFLSVATVTDSVRKARKADGLINNAMTTESHGINRRELNQ